MKNVTKKELIQQVAKNTGISQAETSDLVEEFFEVVGDSLCRGRNVEIREFGSFFLRARKARPARNPRNGDVFMVPAKTVPLFRFSGFIKKLPCFDKRPGEEEF